MNKTIYSVAKGCAEDIAAIAQFQVDMAMESEGTTLNLDLVTQGVTAAMADEAKGIYYVAKADGQTVGSLMLTREWSDWNNQWYWWIQSVYVMPEHRRKGVYKTMYATLKATAKEQGIPQIRLYVDKTNSRGQTVYQSLGMHESHYLLYEEEM